ncbi:MAG TPA: protein-glutamate O-methyltransferase, partial [Magnetospirillaceae bacterium]|nr:protein-glutamate O-methyltransferase [Magnetospirillaceae bacterium]
PAMSDLLQIRDSEFRYASDFIYERFGIKLTDQKKVLLAGRLSKRLRVLGIPTLSAYLDRVNGDPSGAELAEFLNLITTNHSYFFREKDHFEFLSRSVLPAAVRETLTDPSRRLRIWSAGCATGEEPYGIAMILADNMAEYLDRMDAGVLATDISMAALAYAQEGIYPEAKLRELPPAYLHRFFSPDGPGTWCVRDEVRRLILFKKLNLMSERFPFKSDFDVIFCRNVMIYFDTESRDRLVSSLYAATRPGGYLFIGHSESLRRETCPYEYISPATYRKGDRP